MSNNSFKIPTLAIYGVGLIGGSLAIALKNAGKVDKIIGVGRAMANLQTALDIGAIDEIQTDPVQAAMDADVIVLATPVTTISNYLEIIAPVLDDKKIVTDVGSVKCGIVESAKLSLKENLNRFVPGHPIAGKEKSGIEAASADLFENHKVILTPLDETDEDACDIVRTMWQITGADVRTMQVDNHDRVLSVTSHLPHILAYVMMDFLAKSNDRQSCYEMAAGGFYDFTRTASSDPEMWRDISLMNKQRLLEHIEKFQQQLGNLSELIENDDSKAIEDLYASAKQARSLVTEKRKQR